MPRRFRLEDREYLERLAERLPIELRNELERFLVPRPGRKPDENGPFLTAGVCDRLSRMLASGDHTSVSMEIQNRPRTTKVLEDFKETLSKSDVETRYPGLLFSRDARYVSQIMGKWKECFRFKAVWSEFFSRDFYNTPINVRHSPDLLLFYSLFVAFCGSFSEFEQDYVADHKNRLMERLCAQEGKEAFRKQEQTFLDLLAMEFPNSIYDFPRLSDGLIDDPVDLQTLISNCEMHEAFTMGKRVEEKLAVCPEDAKILNEIEYERLPELVPGMKKFSEQISELKN